MRLALNAEQRAELQRRVRAGTSSQRDGLRARIILGCEDGGSAAAVARRVGVHPRTVERLYREVRALRIYEGTTEINKLVIAGETFAAFTAEAGRE